MADYRERIYENYLCGKSGGQKPERLIDFQQRAPFFNKVINNFFPSEKSISILDLGCGHGIFIFYLKQAKYKTVLGIDQSSEQVDLARKLGIDEVRQGNVMSYLANTSDNSYDLISSFDLIEHFSKDSLLELIDHVYRVLRPGGKWIIHTPNGESPFFGRVRYGDFTHELAFTRESMRQLLLASNFIKVDCFEDTPIPHGIKSAIRWLLWKGIRGTLRVYLAVETGSLGRESIFSQNFLTVACK